MKPQHATWVARGICALALIIATTVLTAPRAYSEAYIGGQFGVALPSIGGGLTSAEFATIPPFEVPDRPLKSSFLYGGKVGYYFPQMSWFGLETEAYNTTPHLKQQQTILTIPAGTFIPGVGTTSSTVTGPATFSGNYLRVLVWAPVNLMFRYPHGRFQPYIGFGPGIFFARANVTLPGFEASQSNVRVGVNAKVGAEFFITRHFAIFGEWKYNWVKFSFDEALGIDATYDMHLAAGGVSYHF